jgi:hypothetical protein
MVTKRILQKRSEINPNAANVRGLWKKHKQVTIKWSGVTANPCKTPYKRLDFIDGTKTRYYCTFGNGCTYCRAAPHARTTKDCEYLLKE